jgi:Ca-activated chloride channel family protein
MRLSPLALAISLTLLAACSQPATRTDSLAAAAATAADGAASAGAKDEAEPAVVELDTMRERSEMKSSVASPVMPINAPAPEPAPAPASVEGYVAQTMAPPPAAKMIMPMMAMPEANTENYANHDDNPIQRVAEAPVSTFSIDVDTGSYSNVRRMLVAGQRPPADAVRAEEMINYFDYGYPAPTTREIPFRVSTEIAGAPWNAKHQLLQIGIQGYRVSKAEIPASNLVFLIDTSGSMQDEDKLPLLKKSFRELVGQLRAQDRVSVVVYAGSAGLVLPPTPGDQREKILAALDQLEAGGSTNGGEGLQLAYAMAKRAFIRNGVNRVVLATDGDFNVGTVDQKALETMIGDQRKSGVALTTLGFGTGNYNDSMAERLADLGNGNHAYIDSISEGRKVLVEELSSTMLTIAQDVKIQLEFNPSVVSEYRLIGYENRALRREDFNNDRIDAGEIGAGHDVTALYELTLVGSGGESVDPLRYGKQTTTPSAKSNEIGWLRLRYKQPGAEASHLIESSLTRQQIHVAASSQLRWSAAVAAYADLLRGGKNVSGFGWNQVRGLAAGATGSDPWGRRAEFLDLIDRARSLTQGEKPVAVSE